MQQHALPPQQGLFQQDQDLAIPALTLSLMSALQATASILPSMLPQLHGRQVQPQSWVLFCDLAGELALIMARCRAGYPSALLAR